MPISSELLAPVRESLGPLLFDVEPAQAIFGVVVTPEPENATITFETTRPCFATVELFRMVTGEIALDMEKANRERIELELFGSARYRHRIRLFDLPQERRFWYRISVPSGGPGTALGQKKVRHRGWFSTFRRTATCRIGWIRVLSDSDDQSAGDLDFTVAAYAAARGDGRLDYAFSPASTVESGGRLRDPFGRALDLGRAPDRVAVHVWGTDDDENDFVSFLEAPWKGLRIRGRLPPERRPPLRGPYSDRYRDCNDVELVATLPVAVGRHEVRVTGMTPIAVLAFEVDGTIDCTVRDVLGQPRPVASKFVTKRFLRAITEGRPAGIDLGGARLVLALGETGELLWRAVGTPDSRWQVLEGPPLRRLHLLAREDAPSLLLGADAESRLVTARLDRTPPEPLDWRPTGLRQAVDAARAPALLEGEDGFLLACRDPDGRLLLQRLDREGCPAADPIPLAEDVHDDIVLGGDGAGASWIAWRDREGRIVAGPLGAKGETVPGAVAELSGLSRSPEGRPLLVALDREGRIVVRELGREGDWTVLGTLQEVVAPEDLEPPAADVTAADQPRRRP
ncbi:MAG: hypothetical protein KatS3mg117_2170 [Geminicoccaceae bacterium]|nr:MAG: hypothetical protein KatS3mg117_2170 [Geminicoccaceae bacterium]